MAIVIHHQIFTCPFVVCVFVILGLSKWVRQLVQYPDSFDDAMKSLVAFSQRQQKVEGATADNQTVSTVGLSTRNHSLTKAPEAQTFSSGDKPPEAQQDRSTQLNMEHNKEAGEEKMEV